jgi:hypothetical protein
VLQFPQQRPTLQTGLHKTPQSGGVLNASRCDLPSPAVAVRNLVEQAQFAHLCTVMSTMNHRRAGTCVWAGGGGIRWMVDGLCYAIFDTRYTIHDTLTAGRSSGYPFGTIVDFAADGAVGVDCVALACGSPAVDCVAPACGSPVARCACLQLACGSLTD